MPSGRERYRFEIDAFSPETIPMSRLAEYLADLATMLGNKEQVHFVELDEGSTVVVHDVEWEAAPKVRERIHAVQTEDAPDDATRAFRQIDNRLEEDNASGVLVEPKGRRVIEFPGRKKPQRVVYGPFNQEGTLDGVLIRIGGEEEIVPVHLMEEPGRIHMCRANHQTARSLAPYLFGSPLRVSGKGRWFRDREGVWEMKRFTIKAFDVLREDTLKTAVDRLRGIDSALKRMEDPLGELEDLRHE